MSNGGHKLQAAARHALSAPRSMRAFLFEETWWTWGEVEETARAVLSALDRAGVFSQGPVALVARNRPVFLAALLGLIAESKPIVMVYAYQAPVALASDVRHRNPAAIVAAQQDWTAELRAVALEIGCCGITVGRESRDVKLVDGLDRVTGGVGDRRLQPEIILLTSGTTGAPKGHALSYQVIGQTMLGDALMHPAPGDDGVPTSLLFYPLGNVSGVYSFLSTIAGQNTSVLLEKFTIEAWADFVRTYKPKNIGIPASGVRMALDSNIPRKDLSSLQCIFGGASPIDPNTHRAFEDFYGVPFLNAYGATEFGGAVACMTLADRHKWGRQKIESVGRPWAGAAIRVRNADTGDLVEPNTIGLLEVRAPSVGAEWIRTTDLGRIDEDGFLFLVGRADGAINRGGFKIIPAKVQEALALHPSVAVAVVVGIADERLGEVPAAMIELRPGAISPSAEELNRHIRDHVPATHVPVLYKIVSEMPRTASMKTAIGDVRKMLNEAGAFERGLQNVPRPPRASENVG